MFCWVKPCGIFWGIMHANTIGMKREVPDGLSRDWIRFCDHKEIMHLILWEKVWVYHLLILLNHFEFLGWNEWCVSTVCSYIALAFFLLSLFKEPELITKFLPMLMSFVVEDHTFAVDQKLPSEEKGPIPYPSSIPEAFTKYVSTTLLINMCISCFIKAKCYVAMLVPLCTTWKNQVKEFSKCLNFNLGLKFHWQGSGKIN